VKLPIFSSFKKLHWSIYVLSLASGVIMAGFMMLVPLFPRYAEQLGFNEFEIGLLVAAFFIGRVMFQFPLGAVSDRAGRKLVMSASLFLFTVTTTGFAFTTMPAAMIVIRVLQGVSSAGFVVGFQAYISDRTPTQFRGFANGINSSAINLGVVAGPVLGGTLSQAYSLRAPFWAGGAMGALCFLLSLTVPAMNQGDLTEFKRSLIPRWTQVKGLARSVLTMPAFSLSIIHFLQMMGLAVSLTAAPLITAQMLGWSATDIAVALSLTGGAAVIASPFLGRLSDRRGARIPVMAGGLVFMAFESLVIYLHPGTTATMLAFLIGGAATPAYYNSFFSLIGDVTTMEERGAVAGFIGSFAEWGSIIGGSLLAPLLWRDIDVDAPMGLNFIVLMATAILALSLGPVLARRLKI
jgi:DHA1 family multidrug resistance protein-like MFS transporter